MSEITDNELWNLFTAPDGPSECFKSGRWLKMTPAVKQREINDIKIAVAAAAMFVFGDCSKHLLQLMWIREVKFEMPPTVQEDFFNEAFNLVGPGVDARVLQRALDHLTISEHVQQPTVATLCGSSESYALTSAGREEAKRVFQNLILKAEQFKKAPQRTQQRKATVSLPPTNREEWGLQCAREGKTTDEMAIEWNAMTDDERKAIDRKKWKPVANGSTFRQSRSRKKKK